jgi:DNA repair exonuclease SbcCD ATPase subunit
MDELLKQLPELFSRAHPLVQLAILAVLILGASYFAYRNFTKGLRLKQMRAERDEARGEARDQDLLARELRTKLRDSEALAEQRRQEVQRLTEDHGRASRDLERAREEVEAATAQLAHYRREVDALQQRFDDLQEIDTDVWASPTGQGALPRFVPREDRRTRFPHALVVTLRPGGHPERCDAAPVDVELDPKAGL